MVNSTYIYTAHTLGTYPFQYHLALLTSPYPNQAQSMIRTLALIPISSSVAFLSLDRKSSGAYPAHTPKPPAVVSGSQMCNRAWRIPFDAYLQGSDPSIIQSGLLEPRLNCIWHIPSPYPKVASGVSGSQLRVRFDAYLQGFGPDII